MANRDSQNAPYPVNSMPPKVLPIRSWMTPPISWASPPKANATAKTTGRVPMLTRLALIMLSIVNADWIAKGVEPVVFGVALMFGGITQLIAGIIQLRTGNTFAGVLFAGFGAFWMSLFANVQWFLKEAPASQVGHAQGLFLYAFGIFTVVMLAASLRTSVAVVTTLLLLGVTFFVLGAGNYSASSGLIKTGGWIGLAVAAGAFYLALAEVCEASYGHAILPLGSLARK